MRTGQSYLQENKLTSMAKRSREDKRFRISLYLKQRTKNHVLMIRLVGFIAVKENTQGHVNYQILFECEKVPS